MGLNPSLKTKNNQTIRRLTDWMKLLNVDRYSFENIYYYPGDFTKEQVNIAHLNETCKKYDKIVALGTKVSHVLMLTSIEHFMLPHPSGLNHQINDKEYVSEKLKQCREYLWDT